MPIVSVLMPIYKTNELYLKEAIEAILSQTFSDFEFLILDDCPEDNRSNIVNTYKDPRIKYFINEENLGIAESRNILTKTSIGKYLAIVDHDDICLPKRFEYQVNYLNAYPDIDIVGSDILIFQEGKENRQMHFSSSNEKIKSDFNKGKMPIWHSSCMCRREIFNNNYYRKEFTPQEDLALFLELLPFHKFHNLNQILYKYRIHDSNATLTLRKF